MTSPGRGRDAFTVGLLAIAGALSFSVLFLYATNRALGAERATVYIRLDGADGLQKGDAVLLRGVNVGEVKGLEFERDDVVVKVRLLRAVPLSSDARAELVAADVFGRQSVVLRPGDKGAQALADGDTIHGLGPVSLTARFAGLGQRADRLLADSTIDLIRSALGGATDATASASVTAAGIGTLALNADRLITEQRESLGALVRETGLLAQQLRNTASDPELTLVPGRLNQAAGNLLSATSSMDTVAASLVRVLAELEDGRGSAGMLLRDSALYIRATGTLTALERLLDDLRENPKRYLTVKVF